MIKTADREPCGEMPVLMCHGWLMGSW